MPTFPSFLTNNNETSDELVTFNAEFVLVPSIPLTTNREPELVLVPTNKLPPTQVDVVFILPIQVLFDSVGDSPTALFPIIILFEPVVFEFPPPDAHPALFPINTFSFPVVL